jgi:hypothetical protein
MKTSQPFSWLIDRVGQKLISNRPTGRFFGKSDPGD